MYSFKHVSAISTNGSNYFLTILPEFHLYEGEPINKNVICVNLINNDLLDRSYSFLVKQVVRTYLNNINLKKLTTGFFFFILSMSSLLFFKKMRLLNYN